MSVETDRKTVREQLFALLETALVGAGKPFVAGYDHKVGDFDGQSPVLVLASDGTLPRRLTQEGRSASYYLNLFIFVLHSSEDGAWTEEQSEDLLDTLEPQVYAVLNDNQSTDYWQAIDYAAQSRVDLVPVGGDPYRREVIPLKIEVF